MTDSRKKPGVAFWLTVVATTTLLYVLSSGPANWLALKGFLPEDAATVTYAPLFWIIERCPESAQTKFFEWLSLWRPAGWEKKVQKELAAQLTVQMMESLGTNLNDVLGPSDEENGEGSVPTDEAAGRTFSLPTKDGTLIVTVNDPDAEVQVFEKEAKVEIARKGVKEPLTFSVDSEKHTLRMQSGTFSVSGETFKIKEGSKQGITAKLVPVEDEAEGVGDSSEP